MSDDVWDRLTEPGPIFPSRAPADRPHVVANMVVSVDGKSSVDGRVGALTSPADQRLLYRLRSQADAVLAGAGTVLAEGYGDLLPPGHRYDRDGAQPTLAVPTSRPQRLEGAPALADTRSDLFVLSAADTPLPAAARTLHRVAGEDLHAQLRALRAQGVERVMCEGGPTLLGALQRAGLLDQWCLAVAPTLVADGDAIPVIRDPAAQDLELLACAHAEGYAFLRYRLRG